MARLMGAAVAALKRTSGRHRSDRAAQVREPAWHQDAWRRARGGSLAWRAVMLGALCWGPVAAAQNSSAAPETRATISLDSVSAVARDAEIQRRLQGILETTGWFSTPLVRVIQGVVFLEGSATSAESRSWAADLARNTPDVVAVVNNIGVTPSSTWELGPARARLSELWRAFIRSLPLLALGVIILALSIVASLFTSRGLRGALRTRIRAKLLRNVIARTAGGLVLILGAYILLRISGLTQLAMTVVGGTGLIGLALGIAFRDITENFLASIFLSVQKPFETGDLIEVTGVTGFVQQLNMRTTVVMTLDGTMVQIPNAAVYKSNIHNFTVNPNRREDFVVGIGYDDLINEAQEIARAVLEDHPAVLNDPEPMVLADSLGTSTVNLRVYFWLNGREHSWLKVRSSVIRLVKRAFQQHGISMPDEAREVVFPQGVPVTMLERPVEQPDTAPGRQAGPGPEAVSTKAEAGLSSDATVIEAQARQAQPLNSADNLLQPAEPGTGLPQRTETPTP